jgi:hypothetical protein
LMLVEEALGFAAVTAPCGRVKEEAHMLLLSSICVDFSSLERRLVLVLSHTFAIASACGL